MKYKILFIGYDYNEEGVGVFLNNLDKNIKKDYNTYFFVTKKNTNKENVFDLNSLRIKEILLLIDKAEIVHLSAHNSKHVFVALIAKLRGKYIISNYHNYFYDNSNIVKKSVMFFKKIFLLNLMNLISDYQIFLTCSQLDNFNKYFIFNKKDKKVIPNFIDNSSIIHKNKADIKKILFIGRFNKQKGFYDLLSLSRILLLKIDAIGGKHNKINKYISFLGNIPHKEINSYYDNHEVLILPSYLEVFPMTILEAMARGLVILVSDIPGMREIVKEGRNGYLFPPGDVEKMKELILYLKNNPKEIERISKNNLKDIHKFTAEKQVPKYIKVYKELLKDDTKNKS